MLFNSGINVSICAVSSSKRSTSKKRFERMTKSWMMRKIERNKLSLVSCVLSSSGSTLLIFIKWNIIKDSEILNQVLFIFFLFRVRLNYFLYWVGWISLDNFTLGMPNILLLFHHSKRVWWIFRIKALLILVFFCLLTVRTDTLMSLYLVFSEPMITVILALTIVLSIWACCPASPDMGLQLIRSHHMRLVKWTNCHLDLDFLLAIIKFLGKLIDRAMFFSFWLGRTFSFFLLFLFLFLFIGVRFAEPAHIQLS